MITIIVNRRITSIPAIRTLQSGLNELTIIVVKAYALRHVRNITWFLRLFLKLPAEIAASTKALADNICFAVSYLP